YILKVSCNCALFKFYSTAASATSLSFFLSGKSKLKTTPKIKAITKVENLDVIISSKGVLIQMMVLTNHEMIVAKAPILEYLRQKKATKITTEKLFPPPPQAQLTMSNTKDSVAIAITKPSNEARTTVIFE